MSFPLFRLTLFTHGTMSLHYLTEFKSLESDVTRRRNKILRSAGL
jgi:hypothetical protein